MTASRCVELESERLIRVAVMGGAGFLERLVDVAGAVVLPILPSPVLLRSGIPLEPQGERAMAAIESPSMWRDVHRMLEAVLGGRGAVGCTDEGGAP